MSDLITAYRPTMLKEVVGQAAVVKSLTGTLKQGGSHSFLFVGPSGTGKTTLARIIASKKKLEVREIDAATNTGVDAMRELKASLRFSTIGGKFNGRIVIVDECHMLSKAAWNALLKDVEHPPKGIWWAFCTTEPGKVPKTIETRCSTYKLSLVDEDDLFDLVSKVNHEQGYEVPEDILSIVARRAEGSPRAALAGLAKVQSIKDKDIAAEVMESVQEGSAEVIELCRLINKRAPWSQLMAVVKKLGPVPSEGVRRQIMAYFTSVAMGSKGVPMDALAVLDSFGDVYGDEGRGPLLVSLGELYAE